MGHRELERERVDGPFLVHGPLRGERRGALGAERRVKRLRLLLEDLLDRLVLGKLGRERAAPDLRALGLGEVAEEINETAEKIALGEKQVDGENNLHVSGQLVDPVPDGLGVRLHLRFGGFQKFRDADRHDRAVDGLALPAFLQHVEEGDPFLAVLHLRGVASGGVEQDPLVREPPVAVAGAADTADPLAALGYVREVEAGFLERRALSRAGRADDHVPGEGVEGALTEPGILQRRDGLGQALIQRLDLALLVRARGGHLFLRLHFQALLDHHRAAKRQDLLGDVNSQPEDEDDRAEEDADLYIDGEVAAAEPDQEEQSAQRDEADDAFLQQAAC